MLDHLKGQKMTIEFDEGERAWARKNDQAERDSDIAYFQEQAELEDELEEGPMLDHDEGKYNVIY